MRALVVLLALAGTPAAAAPLPPCWFELLARWPEATALLERVRPLAPEALATPRRLARCRARLERATRACLDGRPVPRIGCVGPFARAARALAAREAGGTAPFAAAAEAASRIAYLLRAARCAPPRDVPAVVAVAAGGGALRVEPAGTLSPTTRYHLVAPGLHPLAPGFDAEGRPTALPAASDPRLAAVADAARAAPGATVRPTLLLAGARRLPAPGRIRFVPATAAPPPPRTATTIATGGGLLARDARRARAAGRKAPRAARVASVAPDAAGSAGIPPGTLPHVGRVLLGHVPAADLGSGRRRRLAFVATVPRDGPAPHPTVLLLHGLHGTGTAFLLNRADLLAARGLAAIAFDLPGHGGRAAEGELFTPLAPGALAGRLRQAVADAVALAAAVDAGLPPPAAGLLAPRARLLGYSLGGMIGTLVAGVEPRLGPAVLVAPAGDLFDWLGLHVALGLQVPILACAGGPRAGADCLASRACTGGAPCIPSAAYYALLSPLALSYRTAVAEVDPQAWARRAAGSDGRRPVLVQGGGRDEVIEAANVARLAAALGADPGCRLDGAAPQTLCVFPDAGHNLVNQEAPRAQAIGFLASDGRRLGPGTEALAWPAPPPPAGPRQAARRRRGQF